MSRKSRALVVGIGYDTLPILKQVIAQFQINNSADYVNLLWLSERDAEHEASIRRVDLSINQTILNQLFYEKDTRTWSGPNWQAWGQTLASNRVLGKLAIQHYLRILHDTILTAINHLSKGDNSRIKLYVIAHAHAPFASGMILDVAYVLHKLALTQGNSVYGMILLPGMQDDPLLLNPDDDNDQRLNAATAYALLRELHQVGSMRSFYKNHHKDIAVNSHNMSPFQTGDCYLMGGEQKEPYAPLRYDDATANIAVWIYLQTATAMSDKLPMADNNRSLFSSLGL